jgi:colanic acid/amylovoran biosynthesis glycosyltransferase
MAFVRNENIRLALISPSSEVKAETFIQAHKEMLPFKIFYYYNGFIPTKIENEGSLAKDGLNNFFRRKILKEISPANQLSDKEAILTESFKKNKINVVLAEYGPTGEQVSKICRKLGLPLLVHFHGYDAYVKYTVELNNRYKELFDYARTVFSVSKAMTEKLTNLGCAKSKIVLNIYGPANDFFSVAPTYGQPKFAGVGRFVDKKAPYYTILAFNEVLKRFPSARLIIAGDGHLWETCNNLVRHLGISNNVELPGIVDRSFFMNELKNATAFVQHSVTAMNGDMEGTPVAILEACAAGVPVIATRHGGIPDVIQHGINGLLADEHDVADMARQMLFLLENRTEAERLGVAARREVCENYTMEKHITRIAQKIEAAVFH